MISSVLLQTFILYFASSFVVAGVVIISRTEWGAQDAIEGIDDQHTPVDKVIICHSATDSCEEMSACKKKIQNVQEYQMKKAMFNDIGYNFIVGNDGNVYEGRGWDKVGAHTKGYNIGSIGIAFLGTFDQRVPSDKALNVAKELIAEGVRIGKISSNYKLFGQRQLRPTKSPGDQLYELITNWPHWSRVI